MPIETNEQQEQGIESVDIDALNGGEFDFEENVDNDSVSYSEEKIPSRDRITNLDEVGSTIYIDDVTVVDAEVYNKIFKEMVPESNYIQLQYQIPGRDEVFQMIVVKNPKVENGFVARSLRTSFDGKYTMGTNTFTNPSAIRNALNMQ